MARWLNNRLCTGLIIYLVFALYPASGLASNTTGKESDTEIEIPKSIRTLVKQAQFAYYQQGDFGKADSIIALALKEAETTYEAFLILYVLNGYFGMNELGFSGEKTLAYAQRAENLVLQIHNTEVEWQTWLNLSLVFQDLFDFTKAQNYNYKALNIAENEGNPLLKARSFILIGELLQEQNQPLEGFRFLLSALNLAESLKDHDLLGKCYRSLSRFYDRNKVYDKAVVYVKKEIGLIQSHLPVDSVALNWTWCHLEEISLNSLNQINEERISSIIRFSERKKNTHLKQHVLALFRLFLMNNDHFEKLRRLYENDYPEELVYLQQNNPSLYFRIQAVIQELDNQQDSALYYYLEAEKLLKNSNNKVMLSNFYIRLGEYLKRHGNNKEATEKFRLAFSLAEEKGYFEYALRAGKAVIPLLVAEGNYKDALYYSEKNRVIADSLAEMSQKDEMLSLEIRNEEHIREMTLQEEQIETQRRNNLQYTFIIVMIFGVFIILIVVGSFRINAGIIHFIGFFSFIFLFEFIILLADNYIHHATHGEPLKIIGIKIVLIAILLPLHHYIEKRVTHYLIHKKLIRFGKISFRDWKTRIYLTLKEIWAKHEDPSPGKSPD